MLCELVQHMVKKTNTGLVIGAALPIQIHGNRNIGFFCLALDLRGAVYAHAAGLNVGSDH